MILENTSYKFDSVLCRFFELLVAAVVAASPGHWGVAPLKRLAMTGSSVREGSLEGADGIHVLLCPFIKIFPEQ